VSEPRRGPSVRRAAEGGFSIVEVLVALGLATVALMSTAQLLAVSVRLHQLARNTAQYSRLAHDKFDELMKLDFGTAAAVQITPTNPDPLANNVANFNDTPATGIRRRWKVEAGPAANTRKVTVRVVSSLNTDRKITKQTDMTGIIRDW
jgi:type II secretory pathway pseudopilin PulG